MLPCILVIISVFSLVMAIYFASEAIRHRRNANIEQARANILEKDLRASYRIINDLTYELELAELELDNRSVSESIINGFYKWSAENE